MKYLIIMNILFLASCASTTPKQTEKIWSHWSHPTKGSFEVGKDKALDSWSKDKLDCANAQFEKGVIIKGENITDPVTLQKYMDEYSEHSYNEIKAELFRKRYTYDRAYYAEAVRIKADTFTCVENKGWQKM